LGNFGPNADPQAMGETARAAASSARAVDGRPSAAAELAVAIRACL